MSYIRIKWIRGKAYYYEEESYRDEQGVSRTRHIGYVGPASGGDGLMNTTSLVPPNSYHGRSIDDKAIKTFGTTNDPSEGGYILRDGQMLDFSGKKEGGTAGKRAYDHRDIDKVIKLKRKPEIRYEYVETYLQKTGSIRMFYDKKDSILRLDMRRRPTSAENDRVRLIFSEMKRKDQDSTMTIDLASDNEAKGNSYPGVRSYQEYRRITDKLPE